MLINGLKSNDINAADRGLAYGDGLFSTIKIESGHVVDWLQLQQEIFDSAESIKEYPHYVLKVILTRGNGGRGYSAKGCEQPTRIISLSPFPEMYFEWQQQGIAIVQCETQLGRNKQLAGLKSLTRLEQVLIKQELASKGALEGLVCDEFGHVIEACSANIFIFLNGHWITPKLDYCGVAGVMRKRILKHVSIDVTEQNITVDDIKQASSIFLSNALMGIVPIVQYENKRYSTEQLQRIIELQRLLVSKDD